MVAGGHSGPRRKGTVTVAMAPPHGKYVLVIMILIFIGLTIRQHSSHCKQWKCLKDRGSPQPNMPSIWPAAVSMRAMEGMRWRKVRWRWWRRQ